MSFDREQAFADFFLVSTQLAKILRSAIVNKQEFSFQIVAGVKAADPIDATWSRQLPDGSFEFHVTVYPPGVEAPVSEIAAPHSDADAEHGHAIAKRSGHRTDVLTSFK